MKISHHIVAVLFLLLIAVPVAFADADDPSLDDIRQQSVISSSYDFSPLPPDAGKGIIVAIISQGISRSIEERLGDRLSAYSVLLGDDSSPYEDGYSIGNDGVSVVGALAPGAGIINVKALDSVGGGSYENIRNAIVRATELGANIIVLPIGASNDDAGVSQAVDAALKKGILIAGAAGNNQKYGAEFPARMDGVVAVGAVDSEDKVAAFSNYGGKIIFAPGVNIKVAGRNKGRDGTSHAVMVAGAIYAILWSQNPTMSRDRLVDAVIGSAKEIESPDGGSAKMIDGQAALGAIQGFMNEN